MQPLSRFICSFICLALSGCDGNNSSSLPSPRPVIVTELKLTPYQNIAQIPGEVSARFQANLAFRTDGRVTERLVEAGSRVKKGQILARLDPAEKKADADAAISKLTAARATLAFEQITFNRMQKLLMTHAISKAEWDQTQQNLRRARAAVDSAQSSLNIANYSLGHTDLKSDADGIIVSSRIEAGQVVTASETAFSLAQGGSREAVFHVPENLLLNLQTDESINIQTLLNSHGFTHAVVREITPLVDETRGTVQVKATLPEKIEWPLGTPVVGSFVEKQGQGILLPPASLISIQGKPAVWVLDPTKHTVSYQKIEIGRYHSNDVLVVAGVSPGDLVVTEGSKSLIAGQHVLMEQR